MNRLRTVGLRLTAPVTVLMLLCVAVPRDGASQPTDSSAPIADFYVQFNRTPIWAGTNFGYTVYETCRVEARITNMSGELILIFPIGVQTPGRYMLPWDGTYHGISPLAGRYEFELFFDDEYAVNFWFLSHPRPQNAS